MSQSQTRSVHSRWRQRDENPKADRRFVCRLAKFQNTLIMATPQTNSINAANRKKETKGIACKAATSRDSICWTLSLLTLNGMLFFGRVVLSVANRLRSLLWGMAPSRVGCLRMVKKVFVAATSDKKVWDYDINRNKRL
jgi:hypothetical protein